MNSISRKFEQTIYNKKAVFHFPKICSEEKHKHYFRRCFWVRSKSALFVTRFKVLTVRLWLQHESNNTKRVHKRQHYAYFTTLHLDRRRENDSTDVTSVSSFFLRTQAQLAGGATLTKHYHMGFKRLKILVQAVCLFYRRPTCVTEFTRPIAIHFWVT